MATKCGDIIPGQRYQLGTNDQGQREVFVEHFITPAVRYFPAALLLRRQHKAVPGKRFHRTIHEGRRQRVHYVHWPSDLVARRTTHPWGGVTPPPAPHLEEPPTNPRYKGLTLHERASNRRENHLSCLGFWLINGQGIKIKIAE